MPKFDIQIITNSCVFCCWQSTHHENGLQNGSKSTNHSEENDLLTPLNSIYLFLEISAMLINSNKKCKHWWWFEFQILHVIESETKKCGRCLRTNGRQKIMTSPHLLPDHPYETINSRLYTASLDKTRQDKTRHLLSKYHLYNFLARS